MASNSKKISKKKTIRNPARWDCPTPGIPDEYFERTEDVPITKEEIRGIIINKARLYPGYYILEVGSGSGSVTIEAAIQLGPEGIVTTIDHDQDAIELTKKNLERFDLEKRVKVIHGDAVDIISEGEELAATMHQAVIIGGTGGDTANIIKECSDTLVKGGRMVISAIQIETIHAALETIYQIPFKEIDIIQVSILKSRKTSTGTMMLARNPVTIISATKS